MKKELNLTDKEKIDFLAKVKYSNLLFGIKTDLNWIKTFGVVCGFASIFASTFSAVLSVIGGLKILPAIMSCFPLGIGMGIGMCVLCCAPSMISAIIGIKGFKNITNGKITYKDYKQLIKSGEIEKWQKEYEKEIDAKVLELQGITPEEYKRQKEDLVINDAVNTIKNQNIKLDSARISEEVKKRIDEHNERQR